MLDCSRCNQTKPETEFYRRSIKRGYDYFCKDCKRDHAAQPEQRERNNALSRANYAANKERHRASVMAWKAKNKEKVSAIYKKWSAKKNLAVDRLRRERFKERNPGIMNAYAMKRYAAKIQAVPKWADLSKIEEFYLKARVATELYGSPFEVDHIVPLKNDVVCGLHVEHNLRVIPMVENQSKGNRLIPQLLAA